MNNAPPDGVELGNEINHVDKIATRRMEEKRKSQKHAKKQENRHT